MLTLFLAFASSALAKEVHVSVTGNDSLEGTAARPLKTISRAALIAVPGDEIVVHAGTYREWVNPARGGESDSRRIVYRAAVGERVEIKGSEVINGWERQEAGVWKVTIPNAFFGGYNPYQDSIHGDWFYAQGRIHHTGEVFLNGKSMYEKETPDKVMRPVASTKIADPEGSTYVWYCESDSHTTTIWANFHSYDPNIELVEISTRRTVFYPDKPGINYITISGFHISQAATQWAAPTAEQVGIVSTHWNKGWIIENNVISDSKCSGISLGKEKGTGHNVWTADKENVNRDGNIHYIEVLFRVLRNGWNKQNIGSHIVRNNTVFNCEQAGIVGSMGAAFSLVENNHIYNIWTKRQFSGAEIAGIKFHAAVDTYIRKNRIHDCGRGLWLDWMTQGTRVSGNLFYRHDAEDVFVEVNHGPFIVDNNILLSPRSIWTMSQGGAFVHNLIAGAVQMAPDPSRFTPYFLPHSTDVSALMTVLGGDDRYYNNVFVGFGEKDTAALGSRTGLSAYNAASLPVWIAGNIYYFGSRPSTRDKDSLTNPGFDPGVKLEEEDGALYLKIRFDSLYQKNTCRIIHSGILGKAKIPKARFENPDGTDLVTDRDYLGNVRTERNNAAGPFVDQGKGVRKIRVW